MQKKIIALAVAAVASTGALAQSNVTIYGIVDAGFTSLSGTHQTSAGAYNVGAATATTVNGISSGQGAPSRLGFKGQESLGNGMNALFNIEYNVAADGGGVAQAAGATGTSGNYRQVYTGLSGNFGQLTFGRHYTPFFLAAAALDPFGANGSVASMNSIHPVGFGPVTRASSSVNYVTPKMNGFVFNVLYGMGERTLNTAINPTTLSFKGVYANGPLVAGVVGIRLADVTGTSGQHVYSTAGGFTYAFPAFKLHGIFNSLRSSGIAVAQPSGTTADVNNSDWLLGVSVPMGMGTLKLAINHANDKNENNADATHVGLGYEYAMSKRTGLYAKYGHINNSSAAAYNVGGGAAIAPAAGFTAGAAGRVNGLALGITHSF